MALLGGLQAHSKEHHALPAILEAREQSQDQQIGKYELRHTPKKQRVEVPTVTLHPFSMYFKKPVVTIGEVFARLSFSGRIIVLFVAVKAFQGKTQSNLTCKTCCHTSTKHESFIDLSLSIVGAIKTKE